MPRVAIKPSKALARLLRRRREDLGLSLQGVSERTQRQGRPIPASTIAAIEQGTADPGVIRLIQLLRLYRLRPNVAADLIELHDVEHEELVHGDLDVLVRAGKAAWDRGDYARGLSYLYAVREQAGSDEKSQLIRQKATLNFSAIARNQGRHDLANELVTDLLREPPHDSILVHTLLHAASVWQCLGSTEAALAFLARAELRSDPNDIKQRAWILHQRAHTLAYSGHPEDADPVIGEALEIYRAAGDTFGEARVRLLHVRQVLPRRSVAAALTAAERLAEFCAEHKHELTRAHARLEVGRLELRRQSPPAALEPLRDALAQGILAADKDLLFHAHFLLWKAYDALGDRESAQIHFTSAAHFGHQTEDASAEADEIRRLAPGGVHGKKRGEVRRSRST